MRSEPDDSDPFSFDGPEIMGCTGWVYCINILGILYLFGCACGL